MMFSSRIRAHHAAGALLIACAVGCTDSPTEPEAEPVLVVAVQSAGTEWDADGFQLAVGAEPPRLIFANATAVFGALPAGTVQVGLGDVAAHCSVDGENPRPATVTPGDTVRVTFVVTCRPTGMDVSIHTAGSEHPSSYWISVDGGAPSLVAADGESHIRTAAGTRSVVLSGFTDNCTSAGGTERVATVTAGAMAAVSFDVTCTALVRLPRIAYADWASPENASPGPWIATVRPDGTGRMLLFPGSSPAWAPGGDRLVFSTTRCVYDDWYYYEYYCYGDLLVGDPELIVTRTLAGGERGQAPAWSPSGNVIAFQRTGPYGDSYLYTVGTDAGAATMLSGPGVDRGGNAAWSPDGQRIAFECATGPVVQICAVGPDGSNLVYLTTTGSSKAHPSWSPDGTRIAFTDKTDLSRIGVLTLGSGATVLLTTGEDPDWSPDGSRLVFEGTDGLFTIAADGTDRQRLTTGSHHEPVWRPVVR